MTFATALRHLRSRWLTVLAGLLVGLVIAGAVSMTLPRSYASSASIYVAGVDNTQNPSSDYYANSLLLTQRLASYRDLMVSNRVLGPAAVAAGAPIDTTHLTVGAASTSAVLRVTATASTPEGAAAAANAVAGRFAQVVGELERPRGPAGPPGVTTSIVDPALPIPIAIAPRTNLNLVLGGLDGLLAAAAWVLIRAAGDTSVRSATALQTATGTTVWGVLPRVGARQEPVVGGGDDRFDEAARRVRACLCAVTPPDGRYGQGVLVTFAAAMPGTGTTTVVRALGDAFARQHRVVVVDANLRRPSIADRYGLPPSPGLVDVAAGTASLDEAIRTTDGPDVLVAGREVDDPGELLATARSVEAFAALRDRYDVVLVDGPPLLPVVDSAVLGARTDGVVVVARENVTTTAALRSTMNTLDQFGARGLGSVLTMSTTKAAGYGRSPAAPSTPAGPPPIGDGTRQATLDRVVNPL